MKTIQIESKLNKMNNIVEPNFTPTQNSFVCIPSHDRHDVYFLIRDNNAEIEIKLIHDVYKASRTLFRHEAEYIEEYLLTNKFMDE